MVKHMEILSLQEGSVKRTLYHLICFFYVQKGLLLCYPKQKLKDVVQICRRAPCISNLLFADDSLIFCEENREEVLLISDTLQLYAEASRQCINFENSSSYFSSNTSESQRLWIKQALGVREVDRF